MFRANNNNHFGYYTACYNIILPTYNILENGPVVLEYLANKTDRQISLNSNLTHPLQ